MKKLHLLYIFVLFTMSIFISCKEIPSDYNDVKSIPDEVTVNNGDISIVEIVDTTNAGELVDAEEVFFEDETHKYIFANSVSKYIDVMYSDGNSDNIKDALISGKIHISDLDKYGIEYFAEPKLIDNIIYHDDRGGESDALETFYSDDNYDYVFPSIRSDVVIVYFKDGTEKNIVEALNDGSAKICDLDWFGIDYYKKLKN